MSIKLNINVRDPATVLTSYSVIRVKRSTSGEEGVYSFLTALSPDAATLLAPSSQTYDVVGKTLSLLRDSHDQANVLFTGTQPLTAAQAADQIDSALGVSVASTENNALRLTSTITGTASKFEIAGGSAATEFGWSTGDRDIGADAHIAIFSDQTLYEYIDNDGVEGYYYKVHYYNPANGQSSQDSSAFLGSVATLVSTDNLSTVMVDLVDGRGVATPDQAITFYPMHELLEVEGYQVALARTPITITTNNSGHAETSLVRGSRWRVSFEGTSIIRDITIPDAAETDLLAALAAAPDPFDIQTLLVNPALRRTV